MYLNTPMSWTIKLPCGRNCLHMNLLLFPHPLTKNFPVFFKTPLYSDVIMGVMASQITSLTIVYSTFDSGADQRKHQSSTSLAFVRGIHRWVNSPHKGPITWKMFPFDDVIMCFLNHRLSVPYTECHLPYISCIINIFVVLHIVLVLSYRISMAWCKTAVSPVRRQYRYCSLALSHRYGHVMNPQIFCRFTWRIEGQR